MLYPTNWAYFFLEPDGIRGPMSMLRMWVSAMAMFWLLRRWGLISASAFAGGAIWIFTAFNIHWLPWPHTNVSLCLPLAMLGLDALLRAPRPQTLAAAALCITPIFLAGHPGMMSLAMLTLGAFTVIRAVLFAFADHSPRLLVGRLIASLLAVFLAFFTAAAALFPLIRQILNSSELSEGRGAIEPLPFSMLWLFLIPEYFGKSQGATQYRGTDVLVEMCYWVGAIGLALALTGLLSTFFSSRFKPAESPALRAAGWFASIGFVVSLLVAFAIFPFYQIARSLPLMGNTSLRRLFMTMGFCAAILAAIAIHRIIVHRHRALASIAFALTLCFFITIAFVFVQSHLEHFRLYLEKSSPAIIFNVTPTRIMLGALFAGLGAFSLGWMCVRILRSKEIPRACVICLLTTVTLDMLLPAIDFHPLAPRSIARPPLPAEINQAIASVGDLKLACAGTLFPPNASMIHHFKDLRGYDLPTPSRVTKFIPKMGFAPTFMMGSFTAQQLLLQPNFARYFDRASVGAVMIRADDMGVIGRPSALRLSDLDQPTPDTRPTLEWTLENTSTNSILVYKNPNAYPRAYFAKTARIVPESTALDVIANPMFDLRDFSVIEPPPAGTPAIPAAATGMARVVSDHVETITIETQSDTGGLVVLTDRMDEGWEPAIDGQRATPLYANYFFRGVIVPPGTHTVTWTYRAPGFFAGVVVSLVTLTVILAMLLSLLFKPRAKPS